MWPKEPIHFQLDFLVGKFNVDLKPKCKRKTEKKITKKRNRENYYERMWNIAHRLWKIPEQWPNKWNNGDYWIYFWNVYVSVLLILFIIIIIIFYYLYMYHQ